MFERSMMNLKNHECGMECGEITRERFFFFFLWIGGIWKDDFQCSFLDIDLTDGGNIRSLI